MPPRRKATSKTVTKTPSESGPRELTKAQKKELLLSIIESIHFLDEEKALRFLDKLAANETIKYSPDNESEYENNKHLFTVNTLVTSRPIITNASVLSQACLYGMHNVVKKIIEMGGDVEHIAQDVVELASLREDPYQSRANVINLTRANMLHISSLKLMVVDKMVGVLVPKVETRKNQDSIYETSSIDYLKCVNLITSRLRSLEDSSSVSNVTNGIWDDEDAKQTTLKTVTFLTIKSAPLGYLNSAYGVIRTNHRIPNSGNVIRYIERLLTISVNNFSAEPKTTPLYTLLFSNPFFFSDIMASVAEDGTGLTDLYEKKQELVTNIMTTLVQYEGTIDGEVTGSNVDTYQNIKNAINGMVGDSDPINLVEHSKGGSLIGGIDEIPRRTIQNPDTSIIRFYETLIKEIDARTMVKPRKGALTRMGTSQYVPQRRSPSPDKSGAAVRGSRKNSFMERKKTQRNARITPNNKQPSPGARSPRRRNTRGKKRVGERIGSRTGSKTSRKPRTPRTA